MNTTMNPPNPMPELAALLKQLRLSGFLESLAQRNREAIESKLAYTEFLALVVQDEVGRREQKKFASRVRRAGFRGEKLEGFDFDKESGTDPSNLPRTARCWSAVPGHIAQALSRGHSASANRDFGSSALAATEHRTNHKKLDSRARFRPRSFAVKRHTAFADHGWRH